MTSAFDVLGNLGRPARPVRARPRVRTLVSVIGCVSVVASSAAAAPKPAVKRFPPVPSAAASVNADGTKADKAGSDKARADKGGDETSDRGEDTRGAARQMAREAIALMHDGRWAEAEALLGRAYQLVQAPTVAVLHGRCLEELGKLTEAADQYQAASSAAVDGAPEAFRKAAEEGSHRFSQLRERIPKISILLQGDHLDEKRIVVLIDTRPLAHDDWSKPQAVNPGDHIVAASVDGRVAVEDQVMLKEGESKQVVLHLHGDPPQPPSPVARVDVAPKPAGLPASSAAKTWGYVSLGVGAAGLATGITAGVVMLDSKSSLDTECTPLCPPSASDDISRFRTARVVSAIGYGVGIVGIGVGAAILLLAPEPRPDARAARVHVFGGFESVGVEGSF